MIIVPRSKRGFVDSAKLLPVHVLLISLHATLFLVSVLFRLANVEEGVGLALRSWLLTKED